MKLLELFEKIEMALGLNTGSLTIESSSENTEDWDSLGHIIILDALDDATSGVSADITELTQATSVAEIVEILTDRGLLD